MSYLIDTDICSAHLRGDRSVFSKFVQHSGRLHVSAITAGELYSWVLRRRHRLTGCNSCNGSCWALRSCPLTTSRRTGSAYCAGLLDRGQPRMSTDLFIAATALVHGLTLVSHNARHFQNVPALTVEDWLVS